jgi:hypothetical protein
MTDEPHNARLEKVAQSRRENSKIRKANPEVPNFSWCVKAASYPPEKLLKISTGKLAEICYLMCGWESAPRPKTGRAFPQS